MSSYLKEKSQKIEVRSRSIEGRNDIGGNGLNYVRFLEEQLEKAGKRDIEFEKMQIRLVEVQTQFDQILTKETTRGKEASLNNGLVAKIEERLNIIEGVKDKLLNIEKNYANKTLGT